MFASEDNLSMAAMNRIILLYEAWARRNIIFLSLLRIASGAIHVRPFQGRFLVI
jgi:hypothetical protein